MSVEETIARFVEAWNRHDVDALAALWSEDGELNHPWGFHAVGRDAVRRLIEEEHNGSMRASTMHVTGVTSRAEGRNVAAEVEGVLEQVQAPNGRAYELRHRLSVLFVPGDEQWRIRTMTATANPR